MIKKEYIQPEAKEIEIKLPVILAGSEEIGGEIDDENDIASLDLDFEEE
ncbi:MAG: hypothetical protein IJ183_01260 [Prevotella sp.]|nr:hypothetical protein [Prevotella sp.]